MLAGKGTVWTADFGAAHSVESYTLTSANEMPDRDPRDWTLEGSSNGSDWTKIDERNDEPVFASRHETKTFELSVPANYQHYRFAFQNVHNDADHFQLAGIQLGAKPARVETGYRRELDLATGVVSVRFAGRLAEPSLECR